MRIGIVSPYALPEKGAASMRVDSFAKYFRSKKSEVIIFSPYRKGGKPMTRVFRYKNLKELKKEICKSELCIITCPSFYIAFRIIPFLKIKKIPFVLDFRDLAENTDKKTNVLFQFFSLKLAKKITVVTNRMKEHFVKAYKINPKKIEIVPNGVDREIFYPANNRKEIRKELKISDKARVIIYEGIIGDHGLDKFFNNLSKEVVENNNIKIILALIVGETEEKSKIILSQFEEKLKSLKINKYVSILKNLDPSELRDYISASDFGLASIPRNKKNLYRIPIKAYDYVACEKNVLALGPKGGELEIFVKKNNLGYFFEDWKGLIKKIGTLQKKMMKNKKEFLDSFDRMKSAEKLLEFIQK